MDERIHLLNALSLIRLLSPHLLRAPEGAAHFEEFAADPLRLSLSSSASIFLKSIIDFLIEVCTRSFSLLPLHLFALCAARFCFCVCVCVLISAMKVFSTLGRLYTEKQCFELLLC